MSTGLRTNSGVELKLKRHTGLHAVCCELWTPIFSACDLRCCTWDSRPANIVATSLLRWLLLSIKSRMSRSLSRTYRHSQAENTRQTDRYSWAIGTIVSAECVMEMAVQMLVCEKMRTLRENVGNADTVVTNTDICTRFLSLEMNEWKCNDFKCVRKPT